MGLANTIDLCPGLVFSPGFVLMALLTQELQVAFGIASAVPEWPKVIQMLAAMLNVKAAASALITLAFHNSITNSLVWSRIVVLSYPGFNRTRH